jgi:uncharacterized damage-inducible protein DinB
VVVEVLNSYRLTLEYLHRLVADVPDERFTVQPHGVVNHPAWVIGHLTHSCEAIAGELGLSPWLPDAYPTKSELLAALSDAQARVSDRLVALGEMGMEAPLPDERYRAMFPTVGHAVIHILTGHAAVHVGQISAWRRAAGYPPLSETFI